MTLGHNLRRHIAMNRISIRVSLCLLVVPFIVVACAPPKNEPQKTSGVLLDNNETGLSARISYLNIPLEIEGQAANQKPRLAAKALPILTLVAEVVAPIVDAIQLQATEVQIIGNKAYVGYNVRGETFLGAVEVYDISNPTHPTLVSNAIFYDADVNGLYVTGNDVFMAAATRDPRFSKPAALMHMTLAGGKLTNSLSRVELPSYAGTDVVVFGNKVYVTSGAENGYVTVLDKGTLAFANKFALADARALAIENDTVVAVAGTPGRMIVFDAVLSSQKSQFSVSGANTEYAKSTIEVVGGKAILGVGEGGTQVMCVESGTLLGEIAPPVVAGLNSSVTVTNAVTADKSVLFIANGEAGVYLATSDKVLSANHCDALNLTVEGKLKFSGSQSANHVAYRSDILFIATGTGGLKIVSVQN